MESVVLTNESYEFSEIIKQMQTGVILTEQVSKKVLETQRKMRESFAPIVELQNEIQRSILPTQEFLESMKKIRDIQLAINTSIELPQINLSEQLKNFSIIISSSLFRHDTIEEVEEYLDTDEGINDLQFAYDTISQIDESSQIDEENKTERTKSVSVKAMTISERINTLFVLLQMIQLIYSFFGDNTGEHIENISKANNQIVAIEQQKYDEQVRHNERMEELKEDENETIKRIANELELSNNIKQKSGAD